MQVVSPDVSAGLQKVDELIVQSPEKALVFAQQLVANRQQVQGNSDYVAALLKLAEVYWHAMDFSRGLNIARQIEPLLTPEIEHSFQPPMFHRMACLHWGKASYRSAQYFWNIALEKAILFNHYEVQIEALIGLGNVWRMLAQLERAESAQRLAAQMAIQTGQDRLAGKASILLTWSLFLQGKCPDMLPVLDQARRCLLDCPDLTWQAEIHDFRGLALLNSGDMEGATEEIEYAFKIARDNDLPWMSVQSSVSSARLARAKGQLAAASEFLTNAEQRAKLFDRGELLSQISLQHMEVCQQMGNHQQALVHFRHYRAYELFFLKEQSTSLCLDQHESSGAQLDLRSEQLIKRLNVGEHTAHMCHLMNMRTPLSWRYSCEMMTSSKFAGVMELSFSCPRQMDFALSIVHGLLEEKERLTLIQPDTALVLLNVVNMEELVQFEQDLLAMLSKAPVRNAGFKRLEPATRVYSAQDFLRFHLPSGLEFDLPEHLPAKNTGACNEQ